MPNRYFDHVYNEVSVAAGRRVSRYELWLAMWSAGGDPEALNKKQLQWFLETALDDFLGEESIELKGCARRRFERRVLHFSPDHPTPEECFSRLVPQSRHAAEASASPQQE